MNLLLQGRIEVVNFEHMASLFLTIEEKEDNSICVKNYF